MALINCGPCWKCKCDMSLPEELYRAAKRTTSISFYCAYGHAQIFSEGESEETKLRRERDRAVQANARIEEERREAVARAEKAEAATKRLKKRVAAGSCPCCKRNFSNMARHIKQQHPDFVCEATGKPNLKVVA